MFEIRSYAQTDSTNDDASALLGMPGGAAIALVADFQRNGRGRRAGRWIAPPGTSLLCTALLPEPIASDALWAVPFWTALCVADGIEETTALHVTLQWPNDVMHDGAKCAGILCVSRVAGARAWVGCGAGINVHRPTAEDELAVIDPPPAFLSDAAPHVERRALLDSILRAYERRLTELQRPSEVARMWERRARLAGTQYRILLDGAGAPFDAVAQRIDGDGALIVEADGRQQSIALADARILRA